MTENGLPFDSSVYEPATMASSSLSTFKVVLYKRPWFLITVSIIVVLAVSIISDLPNHITKAQDANAQNASMKQINNDIAPCTYALKESFSFYDKQVTGKLTPSDQSQVPSLLVGDQTACSFTSGSVYDLTNNIQVLDTTAGKKIDQMLAVVVTWVTSDALAAIEDIQYLFNHPGDAKKLRDLTKQEGQLTIDRSKAFKDVAAADTILGRQLKSPGLPVLMQLPGT
jgi:hypothetical protein